jgi:homoserine dehydrogenase
LQAIQNRKHIVTANKALLAVHGSELFRAATEHGVNLAFEGAVGGGIPLIRALREGLVANRIDHVYSILNGTANYILTRMKLEGTDFATALQEAQAEGYAETEPSLDIDGHDALHKIGILASLAHGFWVNPRHIHVEGIRAITQNDDVKNIIKKITDEIIKFSNSRDFQDWLNNAIAILKNFLWTLNAAKDVVVFFIWEEPYYAIVIENKSFRNAQEEYFDLLWQAGNYP